MVDQWIQRNGTDSYEINKTLLDAYIYYSSCKLLEKPTCSHLDCTREAIVGFTGTDASLCEVHGLNGMINLHRLCESCVDKSTKLEKVSAQLKEKQRYCEQYRLKVYRSQKRLEKLKKLLPKQLRRKQRELLSFEVLCADQKKCRLKQAKYYIINNIVGGKEKNGTKMSYSDK